MSAPKHSYTAYRLSAAQFIVDAEARRDRQGHLKVYKLPRADGGGTFEVAGINDRYHPAVAHRLKTMIEAGNPDEAEESAQVYIAHYTDVVDLWTKVPALNVFLRDCCFNRGPKGALRILQLALDVADDGRFGPQTRAALALRSLSPGRLLLGLRTARETYEYRIAPPVGERAKFWPGLVSRWDKARVFAERYLTLQPSPSPVS
jgi:lysozyme family protein